MNRAVGLDLFWTFDVNSVCATKGNRTCKSVTHSFSCSFDFAYLILRSGCGRCISLCECCRTTLTTTSRSRWCADNAVLLPLKSHFWLEIQLLKAIFEFCGGRDVFLAASESFHAHGMLFAFCPMTVSHWVFLLCCKMLQFRPICFMSVVTWQQSETWH